MRLSRFSIFFLFLLFSFFSFRLFAGEPVHKDISCESCHAGPVSEKTGMGKVDCLSCHADVGEKLFESPHGQVLLNHSNGSKTATCLFCHGDPHEILESADSNSKTSPKNQPKTCGLCHENSSNVPERLARKKPVESYLLTVHGEATQQGVDIAASCSDCHGAHDVYPPGDPKSSIAHQNIFSTCEKCHKQEVTQYEESIHGKAFLSGIREAPTCTDCHGEHTIRMPSDIKSSVWKGAITKTCAGCHASEKIAVKFGMPIDRVQTFLDSFHGLAGESGDLKVANCASCHGWHDVLPSTDPKSRIYPANLSTTCGECHPKMGVFLLSEKIHTSLSGGAVGSSIASMVRSVYLILIPVILLGMLFHNAVDFLRKSLTKRKLPPRLEHEKVLMTFPERLQHAILVLSFTALAYSGFALEYPSAWWAVPFQYLGGEEGRRMTHRVAAILFVCVSAIHIGYVLFTAKGRERLKALLPNRRDVSDPIKLFLFNLKISEERPLLKRFSYIEKAEYWALVWGSLVMVLSGAILFFHNFALATFPLWVLEVAQVVHWLEAILACLAIVIWHLYWVLFDPEIYPMNWAWLTGRDHLHKEEEDEENS